MLVHSTTNNTLSQVTGANINTQQYRNLAPSYLMNMCQPVTSNLHRRRLRSALRGGLIVPPTKTVRYGPCDFAVAGPSTWNALPAPIRNEELSAMSLRRQQKTKLYCVRGADPPKPLPRAEL